MSKGWLKTSWFQIYFVGYEKNFPPKVFVFLPLQKKLCFSSSCSQYIWVYLFKCFSDIGFTISQFTFYYIWNSIKHSINLSFFSSVKAKKWSDNRVYLSRFFNYIIKKEKLPICPICLPLLEKQTNLFLRSDDFLSDEKDYNTRRKKGISPLARQPKLRLFLWFLKLTFELASRKKQKLSSVYKFTLWTGLTRTVVIEKIMIEKGMTQTITTQW